MRRSTQREVKNIQRMLGSLSGENRTIIQAGRLILSDLYGYYHARGYTLTPYVNGELNLTWIGSKGEPHFNRLLTSPEEAYLKREALLARAASIRLQVVKHDSAP